MCSQEHSTGALSSAGRASALQAGGHRFEPYSAHHIYGPVVQLVRMPACHAGGRRFEPDPDRQFLLNSSYAGIAQLVEQLICNQQVGGSSPSASSKLGGVPERLKGADCKSVD